jgi:hypothetical protein
MGHRPNVNLAMALAIDCFLAGAQCHRSDGALLGGAVFGALFGLGMLAEPSDERIEE